MEKETLSILDKVKNGELTPQVAQEQLFVLFGVSNNEVVVCPRCKGENQYIKTKNGYKCAFTDCYHEWTN